MQKDQYSKKRSNSEKSTKSDLVRLNKVIADSGYCSRRKADDLIAAGKVKINGKVHKELGHRVDPNKVKIAVEGQPIQQAKKMYLAFHKPKGVLSTKKDEKGRKTLYDCLPDDLNILDSAGRLDKETSGLMILSSDGDFIHQLMHPSFKLKKVYQVALNKPLEEKHIHQLIQGVQIPKTNDDEGKTVLARMEWVELNEKAGVNRKPLQEKLFYYQVCLTTGINRQIHKSLNKLGYTVQKLKRTAFGSLKLGRLKPGEFRHLKHFEKRQLMGRFL